MELQYYSVKNTGEKKMANKNPTRPKKIDNIISGLLNPKPKKQTKMEIYKQKQKEIAEEIFGDWN